MNNKFVDIKGFDGHYQVNPNGDVRGVDRIIANTHSNHIRIKGKKIAVTYDRRGYPKVWLGNMNNKGKSYRIHRLVALAFIPNPQNKPQVNHKDGNKLNNYVDNLEWATRSENMKHSFANGLHKPRRGSLNGMYGKSGELSPGYGKRGILSVNYGKRGALSATSKIILDTGNGIYYSGVPEAAFAKNIRPFTLYGKLNGRRKNTTSLIYV